MIGVESLILKCLLTYSAPNHNTNQTSITISNTLQNIFHKHSIQIRIFSLRNMLLFLVWGCRHPGADRRAIARKLILRIGVLSVFCAIDHRCMTQNLTDDLPTLVQGMVWCHQAYEFTRPQWVNDLNEPVDACTYVDLVVINSGIALSPFWCKTLTWANEHLFSIVSLGTNYSEIPKENVF